ncbi:MAG: FABP family protein [Longispora sp.]|nr:FABP family protein [Longispora sp. (in: high G+C Gram-positive bacteria)]
METPPWLNAPPVDEYPYEETHDLRVGPDLNPALLGLLPYVGVWRGRGRGDHPVSEDYDFAQEIRFSHDGRPFLSYESRTWLLDAESKPMGPASRETGWWRPVMKDGRPSDDVEVLLANPNGWLELYLGAIEGLKVELSTDAVMRTETAEKITSSHRLYGIVEGALLYAHDMAAEGRPLQPHMSARLIRVAG